MPRHNTIDDFHKKYIKQSNGCWEYIGAKHTGYGMFSFRGKTILAHRFSAQYIKGLNIDNLFVCHACDNPACVNPDHLFAGTHKENMQDRQQKNRNRSAKGINNKHAKLTDKDVLEIRAINNMSNKDIANQYNISAQSIYKIRTRKSWKHI